MNTNIEFTKQMKISRLIFVFYIVALLTFVGLLYWELPSFGVIPIIALSSPELTIIEIILIVIALYNLTFVVFRKRFLLKSFVKKYKDDVKAAFYLDLLSYALFGAIAIYGLILGLIGVRWQVTILFFLISAILLISSFPTEKRWMKMLKAS